MVACGMEFLGLRRYGRREVQLVGRIPSNHAAATPHKMPSSSKHQEDRRRPTVAHVNGFAQKRKLCCCKLPPSQRRDLSITKARIEKYIGPIIICILWYNPWEEKSRKTPSVDCSIIKISTGASGESFYSTPPLSIPEPPTASGLEFENSLPGLSERVILISKPQSTMSFSFGFSGDDIDEDEQQTGAHIPSIPAETTAVASSAFPVAGKPLVPATHHNLKQMLSALPSKIAYSTLDVQLDGGDIIKLPRRELWDVRVQLMAEEEEEGSEAAAGLGSHDVKTGVYEGGFKSWESSVDLVKVLEQSKSFLTSQDEIPCVIEVNTPCQWSRNEYYSNQYS